MKACIFKYKTQAMDRLTKLAGHGYFYHTSGIVTLEKVERVHQRFAELYGTEFNKDKRYREFKKGKCKTQSIMYYCSSDKVVRWWLACSDGSGAIRDREHLSDARDKHHRLEFSAPAKYYSQGSSPPRYEMVRHRVRDKETGKVTNPWTWQYESDSYNNLFDCLAEEIAGVRYVGGEFKRDKLLVSMLNSLQRTPGFHKSRRQSTALHKHARKIWKKRQSQPWPYPAGDFKYWIGQYQKEVKCTAAFFIRREEKFTGIRKIDSVDYVTPGEVVT